MGLSKDKLIFDPADLTDSDNVGAYLRAGSDGDLLTSTLVSGKEALDVNIAGVTGMGIYAEDDAHSSGDLGQQIFAVRNDVQGSLVDTDGDYAPLQVDSVGRLRVISDIDLVGDLVADGDADSEDPLKVGTRAVSSLTTVDADDKANMVSDLYRRLHVNDSANISALSSEVTVGTTAVALPATALAGRKKLTIKNISNNEIFIGGSGVVVGSGVPVAKGGSYSEEVGEGCVLYAIAGSAGNAVRVLELA